MFYGVIIGEVGGCEVFNEKKKGQNLTFDFFRRKFQRKIRFFNSLQIHHRNHQN